MQNNTEKQVYAGFFVRLAAYLIDWIIVGVALLVIRIPIWIASIGGLADFVLKDFIFQYSIYDIVLYLLKVAYFTLLTYYTGATLGKKLLNIRVISTEDRKPTLFEIAFRESVGKFLSALVMYVGYILVGVDKQKRGLHDMLSDTYVVYHHQKTVKVPTPVEYRKVNYMVPVPPTGQPQIPPTGQPQTTPTGQPKATPTGQPQTTPTGQPKATPTGQPQTTPTGQPQATPAGQPQTTPTQMGEQPSTEQKPANDEEK